MTGEELWSTGVGEGIMWKESANTNCFAVVSDRTKIRIIELSEKYLIDDETRKKAVRAKIGTRVN